MSPSNGKALEIRHHQNELLFSDLYLLPYFPPSVFTDVAKVLDCANPVEPAPEDVLFKRGGCSV